MTPQELKECVQTRMATLEKALSPFPWQSPQAYAWWLSQTYYFVCHSTRLLALCASRCPLERNELHWRLAEHIREEKGHELLALRDLKRLGFDIGSFVELPETQAFYQTQYYWIEHVSPVAFFGYILCLEAAAVNAGVEMYRQAREHHDEKALTFLKVHVQEDVDHLAKALKQMEFMTDAEREIVAQNFRLSCHLYEEMYRKMQRLAESGTLERAA